MTLFSGVTYVLFCFVFVSMLSLEPRPFVQSSFNMQACPDSHTCFFLFTFYFSVYLEMSLFRSIFLVPFPLSLCTEITSYVLSFPGGVFLTCDYGLDFYISLCENPFFFFKAIYQSIKLVGVTGASFSGFTMDNFLCASIFPHPQLAIMCGTERFGKLVGFDRYNRYNNIFVRDGQLNYCKRENKL